MKKTLVCLLAASAAVAPAFSAAFTPGNLIAYRVGTGTGALSNASTAIFLDEYTTAGVLVQSIAVDTTGANQLTSSGTSTAEGFLSLSPNGQYLTISGYDVTTGTGSINGTTSSATQRAALVYGINGTVTGKATFGTSAFTTNSIRSAVSVDGTNVYAAGTASGTNGGVWLANTGTPGAATQIVTGGNLREVEVFNGQLYVSTGSAGTTRIAAVGTGLPTTSIGASGVTNLTTLPGLPITGNASQFLFFDLDATVSGLDTLYYANDAGLAKYSLVSGTWTANGTITLTAMSGLTGFLNGASVSLFGATTTAAGIISSFTDSGGYNTTITGGSFGTLATAGANTAFRGLTYVPVPEPHEYGLALAGLLGMVVIIRRRQCARLAS